MNISQAVARVYAEALLDMVEKGADLSRIVDDLGAVRKLWEDDRQFREFFGSPRLDPATKKRILDAAFRGRLDRPVLGLLHVLVEKRREMVIDNIIDEFERFRDLREGRIHVYLTSARPLDRDQTDALRAQIERSSGKKVRVHEKVEPRVLGGLVVKVGDHVLDGTLRRRLEGLRKRLVATER